MNNWREVSALAWRYVRLRLETETHILLLCMNIKIIAIICMQLTIPHPILSLIICYITQSFQLHNKRRRLVNKDKSKIQQSNNLNIDIRHHMAGSNNNNDNESDTKYDPLKSVDVGVLSAKVSYDYNDHHLSASSSRRLNTPECSVNGGFIDCDYGFVRGSNPPVTCQQACADSGGSCCDADIGTTSCGGFTGELELHPCHNSCQVIIISCMLHLILLSGA